LLLVLLGSGTCSIMPLLPVAAPTAGLPVMALACRES
jgi:hypothetical protein